MNSTRSNTAVSGVSGKEVKGRRQAADSRKVRYDGLAVEEEA